MSARDIVMAAAGAGGAGPAGPTLEGVTSVAQNTFSGGTLSLVLPYTALVGDIVVLCVVFMSDTGAPLSLSPSDWTLAAESPLGYKPCRIYYKTIASGDPGAVTLSVTSPYGAKIAAAALVYRGAVFDSAALVESGYGPTAAQDGSALVVQAFIPTPMQTISEPSLTTQFIEDGPNRFSSYVGTASVDAGVTGPFVFTPTERFACALVLSPA